MIKSSGLFRGICLFCVLPLLTVFIAADVFKIKNSSAAELNLPEPASLLKPSGDVESPFIVGLRLNRSNPFDLEFIINTAGEGKFYQDDLMRQVNYFFAALTTPKEDLWVNLSPYEENRVINASLESTDIGRDLMGQDYILKQLASSLTHPDTPTGGAYWGMENRKLKIENGSAQISNIESLISTEREALSKIWIKPDKAVVYEHDGGRVAFITDSSLKVETESDKGLECLLEEVAHQVNHSKHFVKLRQIYSALILAEWFKIKFINSVYRDYINKNESSGIMIEDKDVKEKIFGLYLEAFKKGAYDTVKKYNNTKRRYFCGGISSRDIAVGSALSVPQSYKDDSYAVLKTVCSAVNKAESRAPLYVVESDEHERPTIPPSSLVEYDPETYSEFGDKGGWVPDENDQNNNDGPEVASRQTIMPPAGAVDEIYNRHTIAPPAAQTDGAWTDDAGGWAEGDHVPVSEEDYDPEQLSRPTILPDPVIPTDPAGHGAGQTGISLNEVSQDNAGEELVRPEEVDAFLDLAFGPPDESEPSISIEAVAPDDPEDSFIADLLPGALSDPNKIVNDTVTSEVQSEDNNDIAAVFENLKLDMLEFLREFDDKFPFDRSEPEAFVIRRRTINAIADFLQGSEKKKTYIAGTLIVEEVKRNGTRLLRLHFKSETERSANVTFSLELKPDKNSASSMVSDTSEINEIKSWIYQTLSRLKLWEVTTYDRSSQRIKKTYAAALKDFAARMLERRIYSSNYLYEVLARYYADNSGGCIVYDQQSQTLSLNYKYFEDPVLRGGVDFKAVQVGGISSADFFDISEISDPDFFRNMAPEFVALRFVYRAEEIFE